MAPTILRHGPFRLFFFSREEARMHVHVAHPDGEARSWLTPALELATHTGLSPRQIDQARQVVATHRKEIEHAWYRHFGARSH